VRADFAITPKWFIRTRWDLFYLEISDFRGAISSATVGVEYNPFKNVGFGLAFNNFKLNVEAEGDDYPSVDFVGAFEYDQVGAMLYVNFFFGK
jgi:hypothetical protein